MGAGLSGEEANSEQGSAAANLELTTAFLWIPNCGALLVPQYGSGMEHNNA